MYFPNNSIESIFDTLHEIEMNLQKKPDAPERETLIRNLLNLRITMDQYVKYWLTFEEKVNKLQKKYNFTLPDVLPEGFLQDIELKPGEDIAGQTVEGNENLEEYSFLKLESEQGINSFRKGLGTGSGVAKRSWNLKVVGLNRLYFGHFVSGLPAKGLNNWSK